MIFSRFPWKAILSSYLALIFIFAPVAAVPRAHQEQAAKRATPARQLIPSRNYDTRHIKLDLRFDWEREQALGTATITLAPLVANMRSFELDATNMTFASITLASGAPLNYEVKPKEEKLRVNLDRAYQPSDEITIQVTYNTNGTLKENGILGFGQGLTFIKPTPDDPTRPRQIWSQGETEYNHTWFPCHDHPNDFATSEMIATVAKPYTAISNGRLIAKRDNADNTNTFHWKMDQPHASYLTSIIVGEYAPVEMNYGGIPVTAYVYPNETEAGRATFARTPEMMRHFSELTGVPYPYAKYAQTIVRDFGGGMENITATTLTDDVLHDKRTALDRTGENLISHELAHQWFGDYVTCRTWADIWLNESFATYMEALWTEKSQGRDAFLYSEIKGNQDTYYAAWERGYRRPIVTTNYTNPDDLFDAYAYPRGAAVLHMLRETLGEENWLRSIRHYLKRYAHLPVETAQFRIAIEEATGQPVDWFFDQWIYKMGHPVFNVKQAYDEATKTLTLTVRQEQKLDPQAIYPQTEFFRAYVDIGINTAGGTRVERIEVLPQQEQTFTFKIDSRPLLVNFDQGNTIIKELRFDKSIQELVYQLENDKDVMGRVRAQSDLMKRVEDEKTSDAERTMIATALAKTLKDDEFWGVRLDAAQNLIGVMRTTQAATPLVRAALIDATKDSKASVRAAAVSALATSQDAKLADLYISLLNDESFAVVRQAAEALGGTKDSRAYEQLAKLLNTSSWRDQLRVSGLNALAVLGDSRALDAAVRYAGKGNLLAVRAAAIAVLGATGKNDARVLELISEVMMLGARTGSAPLVSSAAEALLKLGDSRGVGVLQQARQTTKDESLRQYLAIVEQQLKAPEISAKP